MEPNMHMSDAVIRKANLHRAMRARSWGPSEMSRQLGRTPSFWSDVLSGRKSFGEKLARSIEERIGLARLTLDDPDTSRVDPVAPAQAKAQPPLKLVRLAPTANAPLHLGLGALALRVQALPDSERDMLARMLDAWVRSGCDPVWLPPIESMLRDR